MIVVPDKNRSGQIWIIDISLMEIQKHEMKKDKQHTEFSCFSSQLWLFLIFFLLFLLRAGSKNDCNLRTGKILPHEERNTETWQEKKS